METYIISKDGHEAARISADKITLSIRREADPASPREYVQVLDPKLLKVVQDGATLVVVMVSSDKAVSCEKL
jgi:hypothetical protein